MVIPRWLDTISKQWQIYYMGPSTFEHVQFPSAITALSQAKNIGIVGLPNGYPVALHLRSQLIKIHQHISLLPTPAQTVSKDIVDFNAQDVVIIVAFRRRPAIVKKLLLHLPRQDVAVIILAEPQAFNI